MIRWVATTLAPEAYELPLGGKRKWGDGCAQSYFLAMIAARALDAHASRCVDLCRPLSGSVMGRLILQFGGPEVVAKPFRPTSRNPQRRI